MNIIRNGVIIHLTNDERKAIYREQERLFLLEDVKRHVDEYVDNMELSFTNDDYELLVDQFINARDCNRAENDVWEMVIYSYISNM